jgi:hypothetical protein
VDPFLRGDVWPGAGFWLFLLPNTITSLRHVWVHPAFDGGAAATDKAESEAWVKEFAEELDQTYTRLMGAAEHWLDGEREGERWNDNYTYDNSERYKNVDYSKWPIFWKHFEAITGRKPKDPEATFFTCSC